MTDQHQPFQQALRDQHAIEWIFVVPWQGPGRQAVSRCDIQGVEAKILHNVIVALNRELKLAGGVFYGYFPGAYCAYHNA